MVADIANYRVRMLSSGTPLSTSQPAAWSTTLGISSATVTALAGNGTPTTLDGTGAAASFAGPAALHVIGTTGYVRDATHLRKVDLTTGEVTTVAGIDTYAGCYDHTNPTSAALGTTATNLVSDGNYLYWADRCYGYDTQIRSYDLTTHAISSVTPVFYSNPALTTLSLTIGPDGGLYLANNSTISHVDTVNHTLSPAFTIPAITGSSGSAVDLTVTALAADSTYLWAVVDDMHRLGAVSVARLV